jgi:hypothetical protein
MIIDAGGWAAAELPKRKTCVQRIICTLLRGGEFETAVRVANQTRQAGKMLRPYIVYFKYKIPTDKTSAVKQFRIYANSLDEARRLASRHANYPNIEVVNVKAA